MDKWSMLQIHRCRKQIWKGGGNKTTPPKKKIEVPIFIAYKLCLSLHSFIMFPSNRTTSFWNVGEMGFFWVESVIKINKVMKQRKNGKERKSYMIYIFVWFKCAYPFIMWIYPISLHPLLNKFRILISVGLFKLQCK